MPSNAENVVRRLIENGFNEGDLEIVDAITSPDLVEHQNFGPDHAPGAQGVRAVVDIAPPRVPGLPAGDRGPRRRR